MGTKIMKDNETAYIRNLTKSYGNKDKVRRSLTQKIWSNTKHYGNTDNVMKCST